MKDSFNNHMTIGLRRVLCIAVVILLLTATLAGCGSKKPEDTTPSTQDSMLDLEEPTSPPTEETPTETDPTSETIDPELLNIRSAPSMDGSVIGHLQPGAKVDILREEVVGGIRWALIREGWICIQYLEEYTGPDGIITGEPGSEDTTPTQAATQPGGTGTGNGTGTGTGTGTGNGNVGGAGTGTAANFAGTITASELNIRSQPDQGSERLGSYKYGDHVTIIETKNGWGRTDKGWISMTYVYKDGTTGQNACKGVITGNGLNIRSGPGTNYDAVGSYNFGNRVSILERIQIGQKWWGCTDKGWISMDYVYVDGTKGEGAGFGTVSGDGVNIRSGPGTNFDVVGTLNKGTDLDILFQITIGDMTWGCIKQGWVSMTYVGMG